jgi:4'-phosphopantetheinyl transferase
MTTLDIYCLEQSEADMPADNAWLSAGETVRLESFRFPKRRSDWRLGRWTAKCAVAAYLKLPVAPARLAEIEIQARPSGAPQVIINNQVAPVEISLSHRDGVAMCAVTDAGAEIGCDLEAVEEHSQSFIADYFTEEERSVIARAPVSSRHLMISALWSAKESALKVLQQGLRADTRSVSVHLDHRLTEDQWYTLQVDCIQGEEFYGWWQAAGDHVRTIVAKPRPNMPRSLRSPAPRATTALKG